jgi:ABC-type phosphonate transport system ATPase subunit
MSTPLLTVERITKRIGDRLLWRNLSFQLECGQRLALAGATGSGKTL